MEGSSCHSREWKTDPQEEADRSSKLLRNENDELRQHLLQLREQVQEAHEERNFYRVKVSELQEIVQTRTGDDTKNQLVSKSMQNAQLSMEVDRLKRELDVATSSVEKLWAQREQNKHMLLEMSSIVYALRAIPIDCSDDKDEEQAGSNDKKEENDKQKWSLIQVKKKVNRIMDDRRILVQRCQDLEKENEEKDAKIAALEAQFHLLNSTNIARMEEGNHEDMHNHPEKSKKATPTSPESPVWQSPSFKNHSNGGKLTTPMKEIGTTTQLQNIVTPLSSAWPDEKSLRESDAEEEATQTSYSPILNYSPSIGAESVSSSSSSTQMSTLTPGSALHHHHLSAQSTLTRDRSKSIEVDSATSKTQPSSTDSGLAESPPVQSKINRSHDPPSTMLSFRDPALEEEISRLQNELNESKQQHEHFKQVCQTAFAKMKTVEQEFSRMQQEHSQTLSKKDELKHHLKDVIKQYKELNKAHQRALTDLKENKSQVAMLQGSLEALREENANLENYGADILEEDGLADDTELLIKAYVKARATIDDLRTQVKTAEREAEQAEKRRATGGRIYRDAVAQCQKLQHELKIMESRVTQSEAELEGARKEIQKYKEEAKHTRRRLTSYMKGNGIPSDAGSTLPPPRMSCRSDLLIPNLQ